MLNVAALGGDTVVVTGLFLSPHSFKWCVVDKCNGVLFILKLHCSAEQMQAEGLELCIILTLTLNTLTITSLKRQYY